VDSALGRGSTFWIELPPAEAPLERLHRQQVLPNAALESADTSGTVLYVEDNIANVRLMEYVLSFRPQVRLFVAMQGRMAVDLAVEHRPDVIFLDLHLPDMSGDRILEQLRNDPRTRHIPVVMISADATPGQISRLLQAGAAAYVTKPLDVQKLLEILGEHLHDESYARRELAL
jgi:CheY-like chemotaxis protein